MQITGIPNDSTRMNALRSGEVDMIQTTPQQSDEAEGLGAGFSTAVYPAATTYALNLNTAAPHMDDPRVRAALNWAIDRQAISTSLLDGRCTPVDQPLGPGLVGHLDQPPAAYTHDVAKAKQLLAEAGVPGGFAMKILVPAGLTLYENMATALQAQLREIGVTAELVSLDSSQLFPAWASGQAAGFVNNLSVKPTSAMTLEASYLNPSRFPGPPDAGFRAAWQKTLDQNLTDAQRDQAVQAASAVANSDALGVFICAAPGMWSHANAVTGADRMGWASFGNFGDLRGVGERVTGAPG